MIATEADLARFDEKGCWEFPPNFDYNARDREARELHIELEKKLGRSLGFEDGCSNQDASFSWDIILQSTEEAMQVIQNCLRISNYGNLVAVTDSEYENGEECKAVFEVCSEHGFLPVPSALLERKYDGVNGESFPSWWNRYFDWL